ncbi:MAG: DEAD/DEAH box helicase [Nitrospira sp.]|nr:DEAD/DEAH box helicase [Nitrospira sp.]
MKFSELGLAPELVRAIQDQRYETPTPIQAQGIPLALEGRDLVGCAQTGTGKTAVFVLPILHRLRTGPANRLRALILVPTRELAAQVAESVRTYGRHLRLKSAVIFGGVGLDPQRQKLWQGIDLLVATPGRLLDHMERGNVNFRNLEVFVLDEADRMLDMGFIRDVRKIIRTLPSERQTMLFSATMPEAIQQLAKEVLKSPVLVEVSRRSAPAEGVRQVVCSVVVTHKRHLLQHLIAKEKMSQTLVFTRTKRGANKLAEFLDRSGHSVAAIHGNKSQAARTQALDSFQRGRVRILVATDVASRGLDVDGISHVVNFDVPHSPEDYVHRIGRTARAGRAGDALTLMSPEEKPLVRAIEKLIGQRLPTREVTGYTVPSNSTEGSYRQGHFSDRPWRQRNPASRPSTRWNRQRRRSG